MIPGKPQEKTVKVFSFSQYGRQQSSRTSCRARITAGAS
jgi:hypothetical protein